LWGYLWLYVSFLFSPFSPFSSSYHQTHRWKVRLYWLLNVILYYRVNKKSILKPLRVRDSKRRRRSGGVSSGPRLRLRCLCFGSARCWARLLCCRGWGGGERGGVECGCGKDGWMDGGEFEWWIWRWRWRCEALWIWYLNLRWNGRPVSPFLSDE